MTTTSFDKPPQGAASARWQAARRILCVRLDSLSNVLMSTPAMRALREAGPGRSITLLAAPAGAAAAPWIPEVDEVLAHRAAWVQDGDGEGGLELVATLARRAFDAAVVFTGYTHSALPAALLCQLAGIPLRLAHCRENPFGLLSDWAPDPEPASLLRHEVQRQLALVRHVGCTSANQRLSFAPRPADMAAARQRLRHVGVDPGRPWLLLHPGAGAAARRWPPAHWARLLGLLDRQPGLPLVLTGSAKEAALVDTIRAAARVPSVSLAGQLGLGELGAIVGMAALAVVSHGGPAHIAAAVGTPLVDLYALTAPQQTPWGVRSRVLFRDVSCRFCGQDECTAGHHECLAGVAPERVVEAVLELLPPK